MDSESDISIVGAGLLGSALALYLAKHTSYKITVIERAKPLLKPRQANQRVLALGQVAAQFLLDIEVFQLLDNSSCHPYASMCVWDKNSTGQLNFFAKELEQEQLGWMVDSQVLTYKLQQTLMQTSQVDVHFSCKLEALSWQQTKTSSISKLDFVDSGDVIQTLKSRLLVAADGTHSWLRKQAKIFSNRFSYDQLGIVALIETKKHHNDCAWQRFLDDGPIALLPVADGLSSIVWSVNTDRSQELMNSSDGDFEEQLQYALENRLGDVKLRSTRQSFALSSSRATHYFKDSLVLVGDAAHSIHPLAGQGANLGFKDIACLVKILRDSEVSQLGQTRSLARYQSLRQQDNQLTDGLMTALHRAFTNQHRLWTPLRGFGMNLIDRPGFIRRVLAQQAIGS